MDSSFPTFLFLPGLAFNLPANAAAYSRLAQMGYGIVSLNFSTHRRSFLPTETEPHFRSQPPTSQDFLFEVMRAYEYLRSQGVRTVIPVSLSYSGSVSPLLEGFPLIVETAPLTAARASTPVTESYRSSLELVNLFNPFKSTVIRQAMDLAYRNYWEPKAQELVDNGKINASEKAVVVDGYLAMSRAVEGFDLEQIKMPKATRRVYLLGGLESDLLRSHQLKTFERLKAEGYDVRLIEFPTADHIVPNAVDEYVVALDQIARSMSCEKALR